MAPSLTSVLESRFQIIESADDASGPKTSKLDGSRTRAPLSLLGQSLDSYNQESAQAGLRVPTVISRRKAIPHSATVHLRTTPTNTNPVIAALRRKCFR